MMSEELIASWRSRLPDTDYTARMEHCLTATAAWLAHRDLTLITAARKDFEDHLAEVSSGWRPITAGALRSLVKFLNDEGLRHESPAEVVPMGKREETPRQHLGEEVVASFLQGLEQQALRPDIRPRSRFAALRTLAVCELAYSSGVGTNQLSQMRRTDFDPVACTVAIAATDGSRREVPVTFKASGAIVQWATFAASYCGKVGDFLFFGFNPDRSRPPGHFAIEVARSRPTNRPDITLRSLRVSFAIHMRERGFDDRYLAYVLGLSGDEPFRSFFANTTEA